MSRKTLLAVSLVADGLDVLIVGQIPILSWVIDLPVIAMHLAYAGSAGLFTLLELIPLVGMIPFFTIAAMSYENEYIRFARKRR